MRHCENLRDEFDRASSLGVCHCEQGFILARQSTNSSLRVGFAHMAIHSLLLLFNNGLLQPKGFAMTEQKSKIKL